MSLERQAEAKTERSLVGYGDPTFPQSDGTVLLGNLLHQCHRGGSGHQGSDQRVEGVVARHAPIRIRVLNGNHPAVSARNRSTNSRRVPEFSFRLYPREGSPQRRRAAG